MTQVEHETTGNSFLRAESNDEGVRVNFGIRYRDIPKVALASGAGVAVGGSVAGLVAELGQEVIETRLWDPAMETGSAFGLLAGVAIYLSRKNSE